MVIHDAALSPAHVLIVDDDAGVRNAIRKILTLYGWNVTGVADGAAALEAIGRSEPMSVNALVAAAERLLHAHR